MPRILIIRLGALGDLVFCFQAFADIRASHPDAEITLLTRAPFADFARSLPWFNHVIIDTHPKTTEIGKWLALRREIKQFAPDIIYDLQGKTRQTILYFLLGMPVWSGAAPLCKFPRMWPPQPNMHFRDFLAAQLRNAQVPPATKADLSWFTAPAEKFALPSRYAVLIPGCSPNAPHKRWPSQNYAALARQLKMPCIIIGTKSDENAAAEITADTPDIINLCNRTSLFELASILRRAAIVIGNDTGPTHIAAAVGAPTLALFSGRSSVTWSKPPGDKVTVLQKNNLDDLSADEVTNAAQALLKTNQPRD